MYYGSYGYYGFDWTYILVLIGAVICMLASARLKGTFAKYSKIQSLSGMTGAQAARVILDSAGLYDVDVLRVKGNLTDHYDPKTRTVNLSDSVYAATNVAAVGVAAHECGHAIQHQQEYIPLNLRHAFVPVANIGSNLSWPLIIVGVLLGGMSTTGIGSMLLSLGIWAFSLAVLFQIITLPVEFNASHRALVQLEERGILQEQELKGTRKVLKAAALTYVAGAAAAILQLLRLVILFGGRRDD